MQHLDDLVVHVGAGLGGEDHQDAGNPLVEDEAREQGAQDEGDGPKPRRGPEASQIEAIHGIPPA